MRPIKKKSHRRNRRQMILWRRLGSLMLAVCLIGVVLLSDHLTGVLAREDVTDIESIEAAETDAEAEIGAGEAETVEQTDMVDCQPVELQEEPVFTDEMPSVDMEDTETDSDDVADAEVNVEEDEISDTDNIAIEDEDAVDIENELDELFTSEENQTAEFSAGTEITDVVTVVSGGQNISSITTQGSEEKLYNGDKSVVFDYAVEFATDENLEKTYKITVSDCGIMSDDESLEVWHVEDENIVQIGSAQIQKAEGTVSFTVTDAGEYIAVSDVATVDLAKANVIVTEKVLQGIRQDGREFSVSFSDKAGKKYRISQSNKDIRCGNTIEFSTSQSYSSERTLILDGINTSGDIKIPARYYTVIAKLLLRNLNQVHRVYYGTGDKELKTANMNSKLTIDTYYADSSGNMGQLYIPYKMNTAEEERNYVLSKISTGVGPNWSQAGIGGGRDQEYECCTGLTIAGGKIRVLVQNQNGATAIGGGGNGDAQLSITGGDITAICSSTGTAIGGGIGWINRGGVADISITGGTIYAENMDQYTRDGTTYGGVAIGSGSSMQSVGNAADIKISGGSVTAYARYGNGIGSGNSYRGTAAKATISISGNANVTTNALGGGTSKENKGGDAEITVVDSAAVNCVKYSDIEGKWDTANENILGAFGIGGGNSAGTAKGGSAVVNISGGALSCNGGNIGGGDATGTGDGGDASICISGGTLDCASIGGGNSISGTPGSVTGNSQNAGIVVTGGILKTGTIGGGTNQSNDIGFATAEISGGNIQGQFILANTDTSKNCFFHMTGGTIDNTGLGTAGYQKAQQNGGAVYLSDPNGEVNISGGTIQKATAELGGAVYMTSGSFALSGNATIQNCTASGNSNSNTPAQGGAVYLDNGTVTMKGGCILSSHATQGGAVYLKKGTVTLSNGTIGIEKSPNKADKGAGVYVAGGMLTVNGGSIQYNTAVNGAGAYLQDGSMEISAGQILHNTASENGAGAYLAGGTLNVSGGVITENASTKNGGGVYLNAGNMSLSGGNIEINKAVNGAGAYLNSGNLNMSSGGAFTGNIASGDGGGAYLAGGALTVDSGAFNRNVAYDDGGGAYLAGGTLTINGGAFGNNRATNGGGAYAADGKVCMFGGNITNNTAIQNGGGFYVSSDQQAADVVIRSGNITGNSAGSSGTASTGNGGAIAVVSSESAKSDKVVIGLLETHTDLNLSDHTFTAFDYTDSLDNKHHNHSSCPELKNNKASGNGGAIYMSSSQATLNIYCLEEENNTSTLNSNGNSVMAEGGTVVIGDSANNNQGAQGNIIIGSSMLVSGGAVDVYGNMDNPYFKNDILVDIQNNAGTFVDHRISVSEKEKEYKVHYYENFITNSGIFKAKQYGQDANVSAEGALFVHEGFKIIGWDTQSDGNGTRYEIGAAIGSKNDHFAWESRGDTTTEDDPLVLYAIWEEISYTVKFDCNTTEQHSGNMEDQKFTYGKEQILTANTYKVIGKRFNGWNTSADGTGTSYTADYKESKMSSTDGATVTLYAQWVDCTHNGGEHPGTLTYAIAENKAQKTATITENCDCGGHTASVTLSAVDAYHDGNVHPATLNYTGKWLAGNLAVTYQYKSGSTSEYGAMPGNESEPMSTGFYKATIKVNDNTTVSVEYQIKSPAANTTVEVEAAEGEYFTDFSGKNTILGIPADDAFTVQYTIQKLNTQYYTTAPSLQLSSGIPGGTTVIMQTGGTYWYYTVASNTEQLALTDFNKMGSADDKFTYDTTNIVPNQTYRFIFDLSGASSWSLPGDGMKINLIYNSISTKNGGQNDDVSGTVTINFQTSGQFGLSVNDSNVTVTAPDNNGYSRWSGRSMLLKVGSASDAENKLPADAKLTVTSAGSTGTYTLNQNGQFIVPFSWSANKTFSFALNSDTISARGKRYSLTVSLAVAPNTASSDLVSAMEYDTGKTADFSVQIAESTAPSLKITGSQRLVSTTTAELDVTVNMKNTEKCTVQATIQMKTGENYSGTYLSGASVNSGENKFSLGGITEAGSYRLLVKVTKDSQNILEVPYYFNVQ